MRLANSGAVGQIDQADLPFHAQRDSADVLLARESRGGNIVQLLDAATNGMSGPLCPLRANCASAAFDRIAQLVLQAQTLLLTEGALHPRTALDLRRNRERARFMIEVESSQLGKRGMLVGNYLFDPTNTAPMLTGHNSSDELSAQQVDAIGSMDGMDRHKAYLSDGDRLSDDSDDWGGAADRHRRQVHPYRPDP